MQYATCKLHINKSFNLFNFSFHFCANRRILKWIAFAAQLLFLPCMQIAQDLMPLKNCLNEIVASEMQVLSIIRIAIAYD